MTDLPADLVFKLGPQNCPGVVSEALLKAFVQPGRLRKQCGVLNLFHGELESMRPRGRNARDLFHVSPVGIKA